MLSLDCVSAKLDSLLLVFNTLASEFCTFTESCSEFCTFAEFCSISDKTLEYALSDFISPSFKSSSFKLEDKESVSSTESIPIRLDESILFKSLSFISFADIRLILKNKINAKISVKCILFDIFTPPF